MNIEGYFYHKETKVQFYFGKVADSEFRPSPEYDYKIYMCKTQQYRYAKILKSVVKIVVDEDEFGNPVVETWPVNHRGIVWFDK